MRKKYAYFVNGKEMSRKDFIHKLEGCSLTVVATDVVGCIGIDFREFDQKKFNRYMREINKGTVMIIGHNVFSRKEIKE